MRTPDPSEVATSSTLIADAIKQGKRWRNAIKRGDVSIEVAFNNSGVGYDFMTAAEHSAAFAAFRKAVR